MVVFFSQCCDPLETCLSSKYCFDDFDLAKFVVVEKCDVKKCHSRMQKFVNFVALYKLDEVALEDVKKFFVNDLQLSSLAPTLDKEGRYTLFRDGGALLPSQINTERKSQLFVKGAFAMMDLVTDTIAATRKGVVHARDRHVDLRLEKFRSFDVKKTARRCKVTPLHSPAC